MILTIIDKNKKIEDLFIQAIYELLNNKTSTGTEHLDWWNVYSNQMEVSEVENSKWFGWTVVIASKKTVGFAITKQKLDFIFSKDCVDDNHMINTFFKYLVEKEIET